MKDDTDNELLAKIEFNTYCMAGDIAWLRKWLSIAGYFSLAGFLGLAALGFIIMTIVGNIGK